MESEVTGPCSNDVSTVSFYKMSTRARRADGEWREGNRSWLVEILSLDAPGRLVKSFQGILSQSGILRRFFHCKSDRWRLWRGVFTVHRLFGNYFGSGRCEHGTLMTKIWFLSFRNRRRKAEKRHARCARDSLHALKVAVHCGCWSTFRAVRYAWSQSDAAPRKVCYAVMYTNSSHNRDILNAVPW
jgi:hypothetical protein